MPFDATKPQAYPGLGTTILVKPKSEGSTSLGDPFRIRASNFGLQVRQRVNFPDLLDGSTDKTTYTIEPKIVEGPIDFPLLHEGTQLGLTGKTGNDCTSFSTSMALIMWKLAAQRSANGRLLNYADIEVVYPDNTRFEYPGCVVDTMGVRVTKGGQVDVSTGWIGGTGGVARRKPTGSFNEKPQYLAPARHVQWSDFKLAIYSTNSRFQGVVNGSGFTEFSLDLKNNVERYYTFNGTLAPQDITARKRELGGSLKLLGRSAKLNTLGEDNEKFFTSNEQIAFGYSIGQGSSIYWATVLHGVIFQMEEMTVSPQEAFESTIAFNATGDCAYNFESSQIGTTISAAQLTTAGGTTEYGGPGRTYETTPSYDGWE